MLVTSEYHMPRASHLFRAFFQAKKINLTVEEHCAKDSGDVQLVLGEKKRMIDLPTKSKKYQIPTLPDQELENSKVKVESLLLKYNI